MDFERISLKGAAVVVNREYLRTRRIAPEAYEAVLRDHDAVAERFEIMRREYMGIYRVGHPTKLSEATAPPNTTWQAPPNTYCAFAAARIYDADTKVTSARLESNILEANLRYDSLEETKFPVKPSVKINNTGWTFATKGITLYDESSKGGVGGILVAAARCAPELLGLDTADDSQSDATGVDDTDEPLGAFVVVQPGVVFCRSKTMLAETDVDMPNERVALVSERHLLIVLLSANIESTKIREIYSFAWPSANDDGGARVFILRRDIYRDLLYRARVIVKHLVANLIQAGSVYFTVASTEEPRKDVRVITLLEYVSLRNAPDLLFRTGGASGLFQYDKLSLYMCTHATATGPVRRRRHTEALEFFDTQIAFGRGIHGAAVDKTKSAEQAVEELVALAARPHVDDAKKEKP